MKINIRPVVLVPFAAILLSGCALTKTTYDDAPLNSTKFESTQASQTFYNALFASHYPARHDPPKTDSVYSVAIALPLDFGHHTVDSYRVMLNEAMTTADTNHDGVISEAEASAYAVSLADKSNKED
ncbi:MAG TPA: hypothetical protein VK737_02950 [Opitutales bacterium]|jgi:hypothetical protein|nr:hypothetical protein [Opitutales bacterium]